LDKRGQAKGTEHLARAVAELERKAINEVVCLEGELNVKQGGKTQSRRMTRCEKFDERGCSCRRKEKEG